MPAGEQLRQRATQFAVKSDEVSHVWRILDTWDKTLENLQSTDEIPDAHPAMNILPMAAMIEVVRAAESLKLELNRTEDIKDLKDIYKDAETIQTQVPQVAKDPLSDQSQVAIAAIQALTQITGQSQLDKVVNGRTINT